jgi:hypothetical protein
MKQTAKAYGAIDLTGFVALRSRCIAGVRYVKQDENLFIRFVNGGIYLVKAVKQITVTRMVRSQSPGRFFHRNIRDRYQIKRLDTQGVTA